MSLISNPNSKQFLHVGATVVISAIVLAVVGSSATVVVGVSAVLGAVAYGLNKLV